MIKEQRHDQSCFDDKTTGTRITNPKTVLGPNPGEYVGFREKFWMILTKRVL
jgi:hypothetical protein